MALFSIRTNSWIISKCHISATAHSVHRAVIFAIAQLSCLTRSQFLPTPPLLFLFKFGQITISVFSISGVRTPDPSPWLGSASGLVVGVRLVCVILLQSSRICGS